LLILLDSDDNEGIIFIYRRLRKKTWQRSSNRSFRRAGKCQCHNPFSPITGKASSSTKDQTVNVRVHLCKILLKPSLIRSRVCESLSRSRTKLSFGCCKVIFAMEATIFASEVMGLPLWGVPRKMIPRVAEKMCPRSGCISWTLSE